MKVYIKIKPVTRRYMEGRKLTLDYELEMGPGDTILSQERLTARGSGIILFEVPAKEVLKDARPD